MPPGACGGCPPLPRCPDVQTPGVLGLERDLLGTETSPELLCAGLAWRPPAPAGPDTPTKQSALPGHSKRAPRVLAACSHVHRLPKLPAAVSPVASGTRVCPLNSPRASLPTTAVCRHWGPLSPPHTHPEGHPSGWLCFLGQRLSCLSCAAAGPRGGGRCGRISPPRAARPTPAGKPFPACLRDPHRPRKGISGRRGPRGRERAASRERRPRREGRPLRGAAPSPAGSPELRAGLCSRASPATGGRPGASVFEFQGCSQCLQ